MTYIVNTKESINELALAIYDEKNEILREITEDDLVISLTAYQRTIQRLYLIGELLYTNTLSVSVATDTSDYTAKVIIGKEDPRLSDFVEYSDRYTTTFKTADFRFLNALPVDVYVESNSFAEQDVGIEITIEVDNG